MVSKELLSEVLEEDIFSIEEGISYIVGGYDTLLHYRTSSRFDICRTINIYELAHKCKEWASSYGYDLFSHRFDANASYAYLDLGMKNVIPSNNKYIFIGSYIQEFESNTEPEAIFKACQWILENK